MYQLNLYMFQVELQAQTEHDFDPQPTTNISLLFLPFWVFTMSAPHFW